jgi:hypothetical protein
LSLFGAPLSYQLQAPLLRNPNNKPSPFRTPFQKPKDPAVDGAYACSYVATQGPLPSTAGDFWRAMRAAKASAVVMLADHQEGGRAACARYFPDAEGESLSVGGGAARVKCVHKAPLRRGVTMRQLEVEYPPESAGDAGRLWVRFVLFCLVLGACALGGAFQGLRRGLGT